jgi:hypothetical protein
VPRVIAVASGGGRVWAIAAPPISIVVSHGQLWIADYRGGNLIHFQLIER